MKVSIAKMTAEGEQLSVEFDLHDSALPEGHEDRATLKGVLKFLDERLLEMNLRVINANRKVRELEPKAQIAVHEFMDVLYGRKQQAPDTVPEPSDTEGVNKLVDEITKDNVRPLPKRSA